VKKAAPKKAARQVTGVGVSCADVRRGIAKQFGEGAVFEGSSGDLALRTKRLPTGIFTLDYALAGGFPVGRISLISGQKGAGKTTTVLLAIAEWMRRHPGKQRAAWHDVEGVFDPDWAKAAGVDLDRLEVTRPKSAEEAADIFCGFLSAREVEVHALDSIAQLAPAVILESSAFDQQRGELPRLMNKFVTRISALVNAWSQQRKPRTVFLLNQLRQKITGFGNAVPMVEPGGMGQVFGASLVLRCRRIKYLFESDSDAERGIGPLYALNFFKVEQSKVSPPHLEGEYKLGLRSVELAPEGDEPRLVARRARPDTIDAFLLRARESEFLTATDGKFWSFGVRDPEGLYITAPTRAKLEALVRDNPWIWQAFSDRLIERAYDFGGE